MQHTNTKKMGDNGVIRCLPNYTYKIEGGNSKINVRALSFR